jgi:hypothetical protein
VCIRGQLFFAPDYPDESPRTPAASVYDGFGYPQGAPLAGQNGGSGFSAPDPTPGAAEPVTPDAVKTDFDTGAIDTIFINNAGSYTTDELRIGDTFESVTGIASPEPVTVLFALAGLAGFAAGTKRHPK